MPLEKPLTFVVSLNLFQFEKNQHLPEHATSLLFKLVACGFSIDMVSFRLNLFKGPLVLILCKLYLLSWYMSILESRAEHLNWEG